jgi:hypothetical protein
MHFKLCIDLHHLSKPRLVGYTEFSAGPTQMGGLETGVQVGADLSFSTAIVRASLNNQGKLTSIYEQEFGPMKWTVSQEMNYEKSQFKFGFGLAFSL